MEDTRELLQMPAIVPLLFLIGARPGDVLPARGYTHASDGLQWKDFAFSLFWHEGKWRLRCTVTIRNMKGHRHDPTADRTEVICEDLSVPAVSDACWLLLIMAILDGAIQGIETVEKFDRLRRQAPTGAKEIPLPIVHEKRDLSVFRVHEQVVGEKWVLSDRAWSADTALHAVMRIANRAVMPDFEFYDLRRGVVTALSRESVSDEDIESLVSHVPGSKITRKHYMSKKRQFDVQGLMVRGESDKRVLLPEGVRKRA